MEEQGPAPAGSAELAALVTALACLAIASLFAAAALLLVPGGPVFWLIAVGAVLFAACCVAAFARYFSLRRAREVEPAGRNRRT